MNVEELIKELKQYPKDMPVACNITEGTAILVNYVAGIAKNDGLVVVCIGHKPSISYFDKDTMKL